MPGTLFEARGDIVAYPERQAEPNGVFSEILMKGVS
jgi:hypothetical protein